MEFYNTLSKRVESFTKPFEEEVKLYTCGPTVYDYAHIGNLRTYIFEDILEKSLKYAGYKVKRVMNVTDVGHLTSDGDTGEDKMLKGAKRENKTVWEIAEYYTECFFEDCNKLNIKKPEFVEKATNHIAKFIEIIEDLIAKDYAYQSGGNVYFDISKASDYYKLSGRNPDDLLAAVREDVEVDASKRNEADFVLWFTMSKFEDQAMKWDSPWGIGYPGWHIECSGIALEYLGDHVDIHCGGVDNIFPHHTNEIAQSEAYTGKKWCDFWMHGEFLNDQSGKMSKSKGEFLKVELLISNGYNPLSYRLMCLQSFYRKPLEFTWEALDNAQNTYDKLKRQIKNIVDNVEGAVDKEQVILYQMKFTEAIKNDLNTSLMLTTLYDLLKEKFNNATKIEIIKDMDQVLSLDLLVFEKCEIDSELEIYINEKINERSLAKANKDFALADKIRDELLEKGIIIKDSREGTTYEIK